MDPSLSELEERSHIEIPSKFTWADFPWWLVALVGFLVGMGILIVTSEEHTQAFDFIRVGLILTVRATLISFVLALALGLVAGLGRVSHNRLLRNISITYVEFIRGIPIIVLIFTVVLVIVPWVTEQPWFPFEPRDVTLEMRAIVALSFIYGGYMAEIFRAGIESVPKGQTEAASSLGMSRRQGMRYIILPQAVRNILPALGNDFIAMLKDSSLLSVVAVRELTQMAELYTGASFRFREAYLILTFMYLSMTIALSLLLRWYEKRLKAAN